MKEGQCLEQAVGGSYEMRSSVPETSVGVSDEGGAVSRTGSRDVVPRRDSKKVRKPVSSRKFVSHWEITVCL